jgi:hypothetical protein
MALRTHTAPTVLPDTPVRVLLRRRGQVFLPYRPSPVTAEPVSLPGVDLLEADLAERGWLLAPSLRDALTRLDPVELVAAGSTLLADCDALLGADRPHVPLFRDFPTSVPADTLAFFVDRVLVHFFQDPHQPCVLCGNEGTVAPVNPCGHLVCRSCFDGADFSACPICHRRVDLDDPFLRAPADRPPATGDATPARLRVLQLGVDVVASATIELQTLLARPAALPPSDVADLAALLTVPPREDLSWVPAAVPGRETKARLVGWLLEGPMDDSTVETVGRLVDTATDVLRALVVGSGGEPSLIARPRFAPVRRPVRRLLLGLLARIDTAQLAEDLGRHRRGWIRAAERLHPGEFGRRYPEVALAFAALRRTDLTTHPAGPWLATVAAGSDGVTAAGRHLAVKSLGRLVESSIVEHRPDEVAAVLARRRPGELIRRLDHLLRIARPEQVEPILAWLTAALPPVSAAVLLSAIGAIRTRSTVAADHRLAGIAPTGTAPVYAGSDPDHDPADHAGPAEESGPRRVFFPAGRTSTAHVIDDARPGVSAALAQRTVGLLEGELLRRAGALSPVDVAVVDAGTDGLVVPFAERTAARALVTLARGSVLPIPAGRYLRLFCHWQENPGNRVDLDLSVALFDPQWNHVDTCDYTHLRVAGEAAVHSGDLTSAPAPLGATEFVDLDLGRLADRARYAVVVVFSFNDVPFVDMVEAFAGWMVRAEPPTHGSVFDARSVEQRFDLTGTGKSTLALVVDLAEKSMRWLDVTPRLTGTDHAVHRHHGQLGLVASALTTNFAAGGRVTIGELGRLLAAGRAAEVVVRDGAVHRRFRRRAEEDPASFLARIRAAEEVDETAPSFVDSEAALQVVTRGAGAPDGAEVYALHPGALDAGRVRLLGAADLPALLAPPA